jgi:hypothetical protein
MSGITVITPTGDRPLAFGLLRDYWMKNQTVKPDQWIVVDDGATPYHPSVIPERSEYFRREPKLNPFVHSIGLNLELALSKVKHDNILIMEDDDWYCAEYISIMIGLLNKTDLVGIWGTNCYHVGVPGFREMGRNDHAALALTAFKRSFIPNVIKAIPGDISVDMRIWRNNSGILVDGRHKKMHVSMKGMPGRLNAGVGKITKHHTPDKEYKKLKEWCDDYEIYIDLMEKHLV